MISQKEYKIIAQLKAIRRRLDLICEKMGIEILPLIKIDKDEKQKKQLQLDQRQKQMFIEGIGHLKNYE